MNSTAVNITSASPQVDQQQSNDDNFVQSMFKASSHPKILFFHLLFRSLAVVLYLLSSFADRQIVFAILVIVFVAFDFWTVKNVSK